MSIKVGDKAPEFSLYSSEKEEVRLADYRGKNVLVLFFPLAFTGVCTKELCMMRDDISIYENLESEIIAISIDSPMTLAKFKEENNLNFTVLSDFNKEVSRSFGALYEEFVLGMRGVAKRSAFLVDKNGIVRYAQVNENAGELPDFEQIKETLTGLN